MNPPHGSSAPTAATSERELAFEPGITLDRVRFGYDGARILDGITLDLPLGANVVVTGRNGAGKSTLLYVAAALLRPDAGTVLLAGQRVDSMLPSERFRRGLRVGFVFQEGGLMANMSAWDNVALPLRYHADVLGVSEADIETRVDGYIDRVGLSRGDTRQLPAHLSVGNRKRVALARALAVEPRYFFFDDPDVGLDPETSRLIHEILCTMRDDQRVTLVVATNRAQLIERLGVRGLLLEGGKLGEVGPLPAASLAPSAPSVPRT